MRVPAKNRYSALLFAIFHTLLHGEKCFSSFLND